MYFTTNQTLKKSGDNDISNGIYARVYAHFEDIRTYIDKRIKI